MNIFYLDRDPKIAAEMHCDKHVVKMILESAQMMSTAHRVLDGDTYADENNLYKVAHKNHPSTIWVRSSSRHYDWLFQLWVHLLEQYTARYDKFHKSELLLHGLSTFPKAIEDNGYIDPPQCMSAYCKNDDTVEAYRTYYLLEKMSFAQYRNGNKPYWMEWIDGKDAFNADIYRGAL